MYSALGIPVNDVREVFNIALLMHFLMSKLRKGYSNDADNSFKGIFFNEWMKRKLKY